MFSEYVNTKVYNRIVLILFILIGTQSTNLLAQCCTENPLQDSGFEESFSASEKFPNSSVTTSNNALTYDPTNWFYADGENSFSPTIIYDPSRANGGNQFSYAPNPSTSPPFNKCVGTSLSYTSTYACEAGDYTTGIRYIASFDYVPFNPDYPSGGTGYTKPHIEYMTSSMYQNTAYDVNGNPLTSNETAVAWNDVATSWKRAYSEISAVSSTGGLIVWFSHDQYGTCGMLLDNTQLEMVEVTDAGISNSTVASSNSFTFDLNPVNNVVGVPNLSYEVVAPTGFTVSPTKGYYNQTTSFTLTLDAGSIIGNVGSSVTITVRDEVNTDCSVSAVINNSMNPDNDDVPSIDDMDDDNDGITDVQEICGTDPGAFSLTSTPVDITLNFDKWPRETSWSIDGPSGTVASGDNYGRDYKRYTLTETIDITENGTYTYTVYDSYGDGMSGNSISVDGDDFSKQTNYFSTGYSSSISFDVTSLSTGTFGCLAGDPMDDNDNDGTPNYMDADFCTLNAAGVCNSMDADGDGIINSLDKDSDNDGIPDVIESGSTDLDGNGMVDETTDLDGDGIIDTYDTWNSGSGGSEVTGGANSANLDTDGDGIKNIFDLDSDNDGIPDLVEVNGIDTNGDGRVDSFTDTDSDGLADVYDPDDDGTYGIDTGEENTPLIKSDGSGGFTNLGDIALNADGDNYPNYLDLDSDNDGIPDMVEVGATDSDDDGKVSTSGSWDVDGDGLADVYDENASDGPSGNGSNGTALVETSSDSNGDGLINSTEAMSSGGSDVIDRDTDNLANHLDIDADDDGITDIVENAEGKKDKDNGGSGNLTGRKNNYTDDNNDGWDDTMDSDLVDTDEDGIPDFQDLDSDNDGISDFVEGVCTTCPTHAGPSGSDTDGDGLLDIYETLSDDNSDSFSGSNQGVNPNLDNDDDGTSDGDEETPSADTKPDYIDIDADGDKSLDWIEGFDADGDGSAMNDLISIAATYESANSNPGDYLDTDSDNDGIPDWADNKDGEGIKEKKIPPFLDPSSAYWVDANSNGLVALFDESENGVAAPTPNNGGVDADWRSSQSVTSLPVELISFTVQEENCQSVLRWVTANEIDFDYFEIERSTNGVDFERIFSIASNGGDFEQYYSWTDKNAQPNNVYRLKMVDVDGTYEYSNLVSLEIDCSRVSIYPNPVSLVRGSITLNFTGGVVPDKVELYNQHGQLVQRVLLEDDFIQVLNMDVSSLSVGTYYIHTGGRSSQKVMILE